VVTYLFLNTQVILMHLIKLFIKSVNTNCPEHYRYQRLLRLWRRSRDNKICNPKKQMIIHDVCTNEDGCLIIRGKKTVKRPKRFIAKHDHCYKMIKQRQYRRQLATNLNHTMQSKGWLYPPPKCQCISNVSYSADINMCSLTFKCIALRNFT